MQKESSLERDEDAKDLPIELRKLDDDDDYDYSSVGLKSRSLGSILYPPQKQIVRSLSSVPSLGGSNNRSNVENVVELGSSTSKEIIKKPNFRPKLIKQKQSITEDNYEDLNYCADIKLQFLRKQSSLNEELMAESRIREKERIRKRIQKQVSLNETFLYRSLLTKRLQVIREGFTTKFKKSTGSLERITKNGFVNIIKNMKGGNTSSNLGSEFTIVSSSESKEPIVGEKTRMRRSSREFGNEKLSICSFKNEDLCDKVRRPSESDSSKESSLQSDTSVESEDSFASVIHNPTLMPTSPLALPTQSPTYSQNHQKNEAFTFEVVDKIKSNENLNSIAVHSNPSQSLKIPSTSIKDLPEIPKFKRKITNFPIVKRVLPSSSSSVKNIIVPKLKSLEIFNPEIDDSSDSSCEEDDDSTPDSIDSVINTSTLANSDVGIMTDERKTGQKENSLFNSQSTDQLSPPFSTKIQSQKNILSLSGGPSKRQHYQFQTQNQKVNDFILEENEDTDDDDVETVS